MKWVQGMPTAEQVADHETSHPERNNYFPHRISVSYEDKPGGVYVDVADSTSFGNWLVYHFDSPLGNHAGISRLRVVNGEVLMANGFCFWQPLAACKWKSKANYLPVTDEGVPLDWRPSR